MVSSQKQTHRRRLCQMASPAALSSAFILMLALQALSTIPQVAHAQTQPRQPSSAPPPENPYYRGRFSPSIAIIIVVVISAFFIMAFFSIYSSPCTSAGDVEGAGSGAAEGQTRPAARRGVDKETLESFPLILYSEVENLRTAPLECAVCLSEFEAQENLRLLPRCQHAFHPDCIGMWLDSHTTCPVCRANLLLVSPPGDDKETVDGEQGQQGEHEPGTEVAPPEHVTIIVVDRDGQGEDGEFHGERTSALVPPPATRRSRSARVAPAADVPHLWTERERERFTLRLPESIQKEIMAKRRLNRSITMASPLPQPLAGERSLRRGSRGGSGGWSFKIRKDWTAKSDRWAFIGKTFSFKNLRGERVETEPEVAIKEGSHEGAASHQAAATVCTAV